MRIATFNCNSVRVRLPAILAWLDSYFPDLLALQETKVVDKDFPEAEFSDRGWHVVYRGEKSYNGVAVVSRQAPEAVQFGLGDGDNGESETRLVWVKSGGVDLVNTYVPQGMSLDSEKFAFKLKWLDRLGKFFTKNFTAKSKLAWVGDLNVAPTPIDVYDSKAI